MRTWYAAAALLVITAPTLAQEAPPPEHVEEAAAEIALAAASIEGNIYLRMRSGDTRPLSATNVRLIDGGFVETLQAECDSLRAITVGNALFIEASREASRKKSDRSLSRRERREYEAAYDSLEAERRIWRQEGPGSRRHPIAGYVAKIAIEHEVASVNSGMEARFSFPTLQPGRYFLLSRAEIGTTGHYMWWVPVSIRAGETLTVHLDNNNVSSIDDLEGRMWVTLQSLGPDHPSPLLGEMVCGVR